MFSIDVKNLHWIVEEEDAPYDLCAHGDMTAVIGNETFEFDGTASATALYLLKTLTEDHQIGEDNQMMPCCGHFMIANEAVDNVHICGCCNGIDWDVLHVEDKIKITTETGRETLIEPEEYRKAVFAFADKVEAFYQSSSEKMLPDEEFERNGYIAFWKEWNRRRYGK